MTDRKATKLDTAFAFTPEQRAHAAMPGGKGIKVYDQIRLNIAMQIREAVLADRKGRTG
jgi:hypothetical protein